MALSQVPAQTPDALGLSAEDAVLGSMLIDATVIPGVLAQLDGQDFTGPARQTLFGAIRELFRSGQPVDAITAVDRAGWSQDAEHRAFVVELVEVTPTSANALEYARIVKEQSTLRRLRLAAADIISAGTVDDCREAVTTLTETLGAGESLDARDLQQLLAEFGERQTSGNSREYIGLGFREVDENTYLEPGDVLMLGGAPSDGKTALALQIAWHISRTKRVGFYSLETRHEKLTDRLVAMSCDISFDAIKKGRMSETDWERFARETAEPHTLQVLRASGLTADQITSSAKARGYDVILIDYGQLIVPNAAKGATRAEEMAGVSRALHTYAQTSGTLVIVLLQLTRQERDSKRERDMFDLGESSQWEKDADLVLLLYRPPKGARFIEGDADSEELDPNSTRILRIAKQKEGKRVRLPLYFDGDHQKFSVMATDGKYVMRKLVNAGQAARDRNRAEAQKLREQGFKEIRPEGDEPF